MKKKVYSAFVLRDDGTWTQPSFRVRGPATHARIQNALCLAEGGFHVCAIADDSDATESSVRTLDTENKCWVAPVDRQ